MSKPNRISALHITALHEFYFPVTNTSASSRWYQQHFGLQLQELNSDRVKLRLAEGTTLTLVECGKLNKYDTVPINFKAHDARKAYDMLDKSQVRANRPEDWLHYVDFDVHDPDGNPFNIISDPSWPDTPNNYFRIDGIFISLTDFDRSFEWYKDIFDAEIEYSFDHPTDSLENARFRCFKEIPVNVVESPVSVIQHRVCEFRTSSAAEDHRYLQSKGVSVTALTEQEDGLKAFAFCDPEGREFGMLEF
ncbi:VOC family protein [Paenibacillus fonticola]|uniref:VOC family protein n=1 Tax=Paenibacillus fonticola TaxID=379896 RepID=UPI00036E9149|nr:VOC family protein [Paenibacillus fonticola]